MQDDTPAETHAQLNISGSFTAPELESLIKELAMRRAQMEPGVPQYPSAGAPTMTQDAPALLMDNPAADGTVVLRLRSLGLGWTSWRLYSEQYEAIRGQLNAFHGQPPVPAARTNQH